MKLRIAPSLPESWLNSSLLEIDCASPNQDLEGDLVLEVELRGGAGAAASVGCRRVDIGDIDVDEGASVEIRGAVATPSVVVVRASDRFGEATSAVDVHRLSVLPKYHDAIFERRLTRLWVAHANDMRLPWIGGRLAARLVAQGFDECDFWKEHPEVLARSLIYTGSVGDVRGCIDQALASGVLFDDAVYAEFDVLRAWSFIMTEDFGRASQAIATLRDVADPELRLEARCIEATIEALRPDVPDERGEGDERDALLKACVRLAKEYERGALEIGGLRLRGRIAVLLGETEVGLSHLEEARRRALQHDEFILAALAERDAAIVSSRIPQSLDTVRLQVCHTAVFLSAELGSASPWAHTVGLECDALDRGADIYPMYVDNPLLWPG